MFPVEQSRRLRGIVSWPLARLNRTGRRRYRENSLHLALLVGRALRFSLSRNYFSPRWKEGRKEGQDRTGQVRRVQRARLDRRRLSRNTATRRMENKGRRKTGGESVSKRARIRRKSSEGNKFFFGRLEDPPSSPLVWEDYLLEKYPNPVSVSPTIPKTRVRPLKLVSRGE